ncbi:MAG TPA: YetF domain-containing protein [Gemmatimonadaceae bacterium]|nr:YetF domain-containing protein [Gemmatimonadaceae bacterium]
MNTASFFFSGWRSLARIVLVGAPAYLFLLALLHFAGKHSLAKTNAYGLVVTVALGSALASAVLTKQVTLADGVVAIALLLGLQYLLSTLISRWSWADGLFTQKPALLVRDGRLVEDALERERVTESEILAALRQSGIDSIEGVGAVILEADGSFSVIRAVGPSPSALKDVKGIGSQ